MTGPWTLNPDTGEWILNEPYKTMLMEAKCRASVAWQNEIYQYLSENSPYTPEQIRKSFHVRVAEKGLSPMEIVDEFIIETLEGDL